jgi:hypothetical protein
VPKVRNGNQNILRTRAGSYSRRSSHHDLKF